jgi:transcriptional regulator with XRE-family HTH domain
MTSDEFRQALKDLGLRQSVLARDLDLGAGAINRWAKGHRPVPGYMEYIIRLLRERQEIRDKLGR